MRYRLPSIHIIVANSLRFLERMAAIAERSGAFSVTRRYDAPTSGDFAVSLSFTEPSLHKNGSVQLIIGTDIKVNIVVAIGTADFPLYDTYCAAARAIVTPLLTVYNREEHTRYRMTIQSKEKLEPTLPPLRAKLFKYFTPTANRSNLHSSDWRRFYEFVRVCRANFSGCDLEYLLIKEGFSEPNARYIVEIYEHLRDFKRPRTPAEILEYCRIVRGFEHSR